MSIFGMMRTATSGMNAQSNRLGTVADNIANASTHGYKRASTEFSTMVLESGNGEYQSGSVATDIRYGISQQAGFDFTTSSTDIAVSGNGFLVVADGSAPGSSTHLTRAGSFVQDGDGYLVNAAGKFLMGVPWVNPEPSLPANGTGGLSTIQVDSLALRAQPSTTGTFNVNLPTDATVEANVPSANVSAPTSSYKSSMVVVDNVGAELTLDIYYSKTGPNTWEVAVFDQSTAATGTVFPYGSGPLTTATLTFDPANGQIVAPAPIVIPVPNGASLNIDVSKSTELATGFTVLEPTVDGTPPSAVDRIEIDDTGTLYAVYENGQREKRFLIPLATVPSPDNLIPREGNTFDISAASGDLKIGSATRGGLGKIVAGALEKSTVDIASELTDMIESQAAFTANSKVFQTASDIMDVLVNLRR